MAQGKNVYLWIISEIFHEIYPDKDLTWIELEYSSSTERAAYLPRAA